VDAKSRFGGRGNLVAFGNPDDEPGKRIVVGNLGGRQLGGREDNIMAASDRS